MNTNGELKPSQLRAIAYLLKCATTKEALKKAGISRSTLHRWMKIPAFQKELDRAAQRQFSHARMRLRSLVPTAVKGLRELAHSPNENIRLRACLEIIKANNVYGASVSLPSAMENLAKAIKGDTYSKGNLSKKIIESLSRGEIPPNVIGPLLRMVNNIEESREALTIESLARRASDVDNEILMDRIKAGRAAGKSDEEISYEEQYDYHKRKMKRCERLAEVSRRQKEKGIIGELIEFTKKTADKEGLLEDDDGDEE